MLVSKDVFNLVKSYFFRGGKSSLNMAIKIFCLFPAGLEPATFRVWGERDNHYTTETWMSCSENSRNILSL